MSPRLFSFIIIIYILSAHLLTHLTPIYDMALKYVLVDNKLTPDPDDCSARTQDVRNVPFEEVISRMTGRGLTLTDTEVQSVFNEFEHVIIDCLEEGCSVSTPFLKISPSIMGVFHNPDDAFDPARHAVRLNASLGNSIVIDQRKMKLQKEKLSAVQPEIVSVKDYQTMQVNEVIMRNSTVEIKGSDLKIYPEDQEQGIFIGNQGNEVRVSIYMMNKPSLLIFQVPQNVPGGEVYIKVKNKLMKGNTLRTGTFGTNLTVID